MRSDKLVVFVTVLMFFVFVFVFFIFVCVFINVHFVHPSFTHLIKYFRSIFLLWSQFIFQWEILRSEIFQILFEVLSMIKLYNVLYVLPYKSGFFLSDILNIIFGTLSPHPKVFIENKKKNTSHCTPNKQLFLGET